MSPAPVSPAPVSPAPVSLEPDASPAAAARPSAGAFFAERAATGAVLAPMAGFTDAPFRRLCRHYGAAWAVTEMVSAKGLAEGTGGGIEIAEPYPDEPDVVIQLFAADPELAHAAVVRLERRYRPAAFDLNMGCPVKKVVHRGCGSELLRDPARAAAIVAAMVAATERPVSVKLRLGVDSFVAVEVARAVVGAGAVALAVHGRTARQRYEGVADWERIAAVAESVDVPVMGSGDVDDEAGYVAARKRGLGVMIARGALGRPWVFARVRGAPQPATAEIALVAWRHVVDHVAWYGGEVALRRLRAQLGHYATAALAHAPPDERAAFRASVVRAERADDVAEAFARFVGVDPRRSVAGTHPALRSLVDAPALRREVERPVAGRRPSRVGG